MKKKKELWMLLAAALILLLVLTELHATACATQLTVAHYEVPADITENIRIVHLTDLHGDVPFDADNRALVELVAQQKPDLILMTGDMLDKTDANADAACSLIEACKEIAPVYYGYGNHEYAWVQEHGEILAEELTRAGATVLNVEYCDLTVKDQQLRIGGYYNYYRQPHMFRLTKEEKQAEIAFADAFENTQRYKILLSHIPTAWIDWEYIDKYPVDLVLTGHYHGGQIRLPFLGGLYAPYIGLFPEYTEGMYTGTMATAILSTGLGSNPGVPRINNPAQLVVVDLLAEAT